MTLVRGTRVLLVIDGILLVAWPVSAALGGALALAWRGADARWAQRSVAVLFVLTTLFLAADALAF